MVKYRDFKRWEVATQSVRRRMLERLSRGGAMSLSKMADPYGITLPAALKHARILENAGLITTHKQGRIRICVLDRGAFKEFSDYLAAQAAFWQGSFRRFERHLARKKAPAIKRIIRSKRA